MTNLSAGQLSLLIASIACFIGATVTSLLRGRGEAEGARFASKGMSAAGLLLGFGVLGWHSADRDTWLPLGDNFDTLVCLGLLLAAFVLYMQVMRPLRGLDWFVLPMVVALLIGAGIFGQTKPHEYLDTAWSWVHRITAYGGAAAFAVACAGGLMYLIVHRRLRSKAAKLAGPGGGFGSLERLEHLTLVAVALGFGLLTIGLVTGWIWVTRLRGETSLGDRWYLNPKVLLAVGVWLVYAVVLHSPINPSFRGRRAAVLSVVGFALMIGTLVAAQFVPSGK